MCMCGPWSAAEPGQNKRRMQGSQKWIKKTPFYQLQLDLKICLIRFHFEHSSDTYVKLSIRMKAVGGGVAAATIVFKDLSYTVSL